VLSNVNSSFGNFMEQFHISIYARFELAIRRGKLKQKGEFSEPLGNDSSID
jgi:hypothetical protein